MKRCYFVGFSYDSGNIRFFAGGFFMNFVKILKEKAGALVEAKSLKQWKSLCESENSCFLAFFDS